MGIIGGKSEVDGSSLRIEAQMDCKGFQNRGLSHTIFPHEEGHPLGDGEPFHLLQMPYHRQFLEPAFLWQFVADGNCADKQIAEQVSSLPCGSWDDYTTASVRETGHFHFFPKNWLDSHPAS